MIWHRMKGCRLACFAVMGGLATSIAGALAAESGASGDFLAVDRASGPFRMLAGTWEGDIGGRLGSGQGIRRYEFALDDQYLVMTHASVRLPQEKSPQGDYHRELAIFSTDQTNRQVILRAFNVEGFVLTYGCETSPKRIRCTSRFIEDGPDMRARLTIEIESRYRFTETFELAGAGDDLQTYFTNTWTRKPDLAD